MGPYWSTKKPATSMVHRFPGSGENASHFESVNFETFTLVWLDPKLEKTDDNMALLTKLRGSMNCVRTFTHSDTCRLFIETQSIDEPLILLVSGTAGRELIPLVHNLEQVASIYVFCTNRAHHLTWTRSFSKVKHLRARSSPN
jgi:hypothetical protein